MAEFTNREELEAWLEGQPRAVSIVIGARAALRVLPLLAVEFSKNKQKLEFVASHIVLPVFRATAVPWSAANYPDHGAELAAFAAEAAAAAHAAARSTTHAVYNAPAHFATHDAAQAAADAAADAAAAHADTARAAAYSARAADGAAAAAAQTATYAAAYSASTALWQALRDDATRIENATPGKPAGEALWDNKTPDWFHSHWEQLKLNLIGLDPDWQRWTYWYEARRDGRPTYRASSKQNKQIEIARAKISDEIWNEGPAAVFAEIERLEDEILGEKELGEIGPDDNADSEPPPQWAEVLSDLGPAQYGFSFRVEADKFAIDYSGDESDAAVADDPITQQLHGQLKRKSKAWAAQAIRLDNQIGWTGIGATSRRLSEALDGETSEVARRIGEVWGEFVELGSFPELDGQVRGGTDSNVTPLDPELRRPLTDLITTGAPWVRRFPSARELDDETPIFLSGREVLELAKSIIVSAGDSQLIIKGDAELIKGLFDAAERGTHQSKKAGTRGLQTARSFINKSASYVAGFYMGAIASAYSAGSPSIQAISQFMIQFEKDIITLTTYSPADISIALRELMKRLHEDAARNEVPMPQPPQIVDGESKRRR